MNPRQLRTLWVSIGVIVVILLFPPWQYRSVSYGLFTGPYHFVFLGAPSPAAELDLVRLTLPILIVVIVSAGLMVTFSRE